jgi:acetoin utilization protein AcuB
MSKHPITVTANVHIDEALKAMRDNKVRRLPVVDKKGQLVGIVSEMDLLYASPSPATSLSVYEIHYLMARITVQDVMTKEVISIEEDTLLEEAARIMVDNKIGGLPVVRNGTLVGIITETDLFKIFLELLGAREKGVRLTLQTPNKKGVLASLTGQIARPDCPDGWRHHQLGHLSGRGPHRRSDHRQGGWGASRPTDGSLRNSRDETGGRAGKLKA